MKKYIFTLALVFLVGAGCDWRGIEGNGRVTTETRQIDPFTTLETSGAYRVEWSPGPVSLQVVTDENLHQYVKTSIDGDKLVIRTRQRINPTESVKVLLTSPALAAVELTGASRFTGKGVTGEKFVVRTTGASRVTLEGNVNELTASHTGASRLNAEELKTQNATLDLTGASKAEISVEKTLKVAISGAGKVTYKGDPKILEQQIAGAGKIQRKD